MAADWGHPLLTGADGDAVLGLRFSGYYGAAGARTAQGYRRFRCRECGSTPALAKELRRRRRRGIGAAGT